MNRRPVRTNTPCLLIAATLTLTASLLGGCFQQHEDLAMARAISAEASDPARSTLPEATQIPPLSPGQRDARSVAGLSRANWSSVKVTPTYLGLRTIKPYTRGPRYITEVARQRGEYPAITTATDDTSEVGRCELVAEGFAAPGWALLDLLMLGPRLLMEPIWKPAAYETKNIWTPAPVAGVAPRGTGVITLPPAELPSEVTPAPTSPSSSKPAPTATPAKSTPKGSTK